MIRIDRSRRAAHRNRRDRGCLRSSASAAASTAALPPSADGTAAESALTKAVARDFGGKPGQITEMDALVAYLQMLGTLVDFKLYNEKANLR